MCSEPNNSKGPLRRIRAVSPTMEGFKDMCVFFRNAKGTLGLYLTNGQQGTSIMHVVFTSYGGGLYIWSCVLCVHVFFKNRVGIEVLADLTQSCRNPVSAHHITFCKIKSVLTQFRMLFATVVNDQF